jgi:hypothetical protein
MPISRHRRKGQYRPRVRQKPSPELILTPKGRRLLELCRARLTELHGDREWTEDEFAAVLDQLQDEGTLLPYQVLERAC